MTKPLAIIHANCQGEHLVSALCASPEFNRAYDLRLFINYTRQEIPEADLGACALFLYQYLSPEWGDLSSQALLAKLPAGCPSLCIPNIFFRAYWPLWSGKPGFDYRDVYLDHLLSMNLPRQDILHMYLETKLANKYDLDALLAETITKEREREARTPVKYLDLILERYLRERLLYTVNHPGAMLLAHCAQGILREIGMASPSPMPLPELEHYYASFEQPIHPQVAQRLGLSFISPHTVYNIYGRPMTFSQYACAYVDCRLAGIEEFMGYLQVI